MNPRMVGLTGNIGCGKSTVAKMLAAFPDVATYDVDQIWKELLVGTVCRLFVEELIGPESFVDDTPQFNFIASEIFAHAEKRDLLELFAKRQVMGEIFSRIEKSTKSIHVVESAMLYETGVYLEFSEVIVAVCDAEEQVRRVLARPIPGREPLTREQFDERAKTQWPQEDKAALAKYTIDTFCSLSELEGRVKDLYEKISGGNHA